MSKNDTIVVTSTDTLSRAIGEITKNTEDKITKQWALNTLAKHIAGKKESWGYLTQPSSNAKFPEQLLKRGQPKQIAKALRDCDEPCPANLALSTRRYRADYFIEVYLNALCWLRDEEIIDLNFEELEDFLLLKRIIDLSNEAKFPDMPKKIRRGLKNYLLSLPGYEDDRGYKQAINTFGFHTEVHIIWLRILQSIQ